MKDDKNNRVLNITFVLILAILFGIYCFSLIMLHFNQTLYTETGLYESDLFAHIEMALDGWGYSIIAIVIGILHFLPGKLFNFGIALFLAAVEAGTMYAAFAFFQKKTKNPLASIILAFASGFVMPAFIGSIQPYRYIGYQSPSIWHNSTYIVMKLFALLSVMLYMSISEKYNETLDVKRVVIFSVLLALTTSVKTNFILAFAPVALLFLVIDGILGVKVKRLLLCALTVIPSLGVVLFQRIVLFGEETGNKVIVDPLYSVYLRAEKPYFTMILSAAFPVLILLVNIIFVLKDTLKDFKKRDGRLTHREFIFSWGMWFVGFVELLLLRETGARELDDNFAWGYDFCLFMVFIISFVYFVKNLTEEKIKNKIVKIAYAFVGTALAGYHLYCGVYFFVRLCFGATFFMQ